ncbi:MAG: peptide chain release factor N(5)-glutamine methyltransferase [Pelagibacteraceae bacterium]|nr:peptide chain release factor N(5)-glutamine methyltransferase [Pelagibacteraceae bacterium]MBO6488822.1 peptide chain release factor N(5)-glutamine methyltransferase [Pelagibacteraceae bacterium]
MKTTQLLDFGSNILRSKKIISHRIDSEVILSYILKISREKLLIKEDKVCNENIIKFRSLISRRLKQEPVAYIIARKEFRSEDFFVDKKSLIPRPETELLIDPIVKIFKNKNLFFLDIGVGSGCIIFSILKELNHSKGIGIDICKKAVLNAKINLNRFNLKNRVKLLNKSVDQVLNKKFDLVVSNPPYIVKRDINRLANDIRKFEPKIALDGGNDGLDVIKKVIYKSKEILKVKGILALEIGRGQYFSVARVLRENNFRQIRIVKDYQNNIRCIFSTL